MDQEVEEVFQKVASQMYNVQHSIDSLERSIQAQNVSEIIEEMSKQITALQAQIIDKDQFILSFQQQMITRLMEILSESRVLTGPAYRRLQPKLDDLQRFLSNPEIYIKRKV